MKKEIKEKADELVKVFQSLQINKGEEFKIIDSDMGKFAASTCAEAMIRECKINNPDRVDFWVKVKHYIG